MFDDTSFFFASLRLRCIVMFSYITTINELGISFTYWLRFFALLFIFVTLFVTIRRPGRRINPLILDSQALFARYQ